MGRRPEEFGVSSSNVNILQIPASAFVPRDSSMTYGYNNFGYIYISSKGGCLWAPVTLPTGAIIVFLDLYYLDVDPVFDLFTGLYKYGWWGPPGVSENQIVNITSSGSAGLGYASSDELSYFVDINVRFDINDGGQLQVLVCTPSGTPDLEFKAVDIWWVRQMSPAPATATFADVPKDYIYFRAIEALAASGITQGCGAGNFCPNGNVTRGEMAAFLARALGLHWTH